MEIKEATVVDVEVSESGGERGSREEREKARGGSSSEHVVLVVEGRFDGQNRGRVCDGDLDRSRPVVERLCDVGGEEDVERCSEGSVESPHRLERPPVQDGVGSDHTVTDLVGVDLSSECKGCERSARRTGDREGREDVVWDGDAESSEDAHKVRQEVAGSRE